MKSTFLPSFLPGVYLGLALIIFTLLVYLINIDLQSPIKYISYVIMIAGLTISIVTFRNNQMDGYITYGKAFSVGFYTGLFASIIAGIFTVIYVQYIDTELISNILAIAEENMLEQRPDMTNEQLEQALSMTEIFTTPIMMGVMGFISNVILSAVFSLIIAIFAKREDKSIA